MSCKALSISKRQQIIKNELKNFPSLSQPKNLTSLSSLHETFLISSTPKKSRSVKKGNSLNLDKKELVGKFSLKGRVEGKQKNKVKNLCKKKWLDLKEGQLSKTSEKFSNKTVTLPSTNQLSECESNVLDENVQNGTKLEKIQVNDAETEEPNSAVGANPQINMNLFIIIYIHQRILFILLFFPCLLTTPTSTPPVSKGSLPLTPSTKPASSIKTLCTGAKIFTRKPTRNCKKLGNCR